MGIENISFAFYLSNRFSSRQPFCGYHILSWKPFPKLGFWQTLPALLATFSTNLSPTLVITVCSLGFSLPRGFSPHPPRDSPKTDAFYFVRLIGYPFTNVDPFPYLALVYYERQLWPVPAFFSSRSCIFFLFWIYIFMSFTISFGIECLWTELVLWIRVEYRLFVPYPMGTAACSTADALCLEGFCSPLWPTLIIPYSSQKNPQSFCGESFPPSAKVGECAIS